MPFQIIKKCPKTNARISTLPLTHHTATLPIFMPVATHGILKAKHTYDDEITLGNTFHLRMLNRDLHEFMGLGKGLLTDSGGFQIISLRNFVCEDGVVFLDYDSDGRRVGVSVSGVSSSGVGGSNSNNGSNSSSHSNGSSASSNGSNSHSNSSNSNRSNESESKTTFCKNPYCLSPTCQGCAPLPAQKAKYSARPVQNHPHFLLTPEKSIKIQNTLNSDIAMQLDDVIRPCAPRARHLEAVKRSIRWLDRCLRASRNPAQALFPIIQGGLHDDLRALSADEILKRGPAGVAIGGLCGGEDKRQFCAVVFSTVNHVRRRAECPVYVMGVGYPEDVVISIMLGSDMSDCVYPTRTARFGRMFSDYGDINIHSFKNVHGVSHDGVNHDGVGREDVSHVDVSHDGVSHAQCKDIHEDVSQAASKDVYESHSPVKDSPPSNKDSPPRGTFKRNGLVWNNCKCRTCLFVSLNFLKAIRNTPNFCILLTEHNLFYMRELTARIRRGIEEGNLDVFIKAWMNRKYNGNVPDWVKYAYDLVKI